MTSLDKNINWTRLCIDAILNYPSILKEKQDLQQKILNHKAVGILTISDLDKISLCKLLTPKCATFHSLDKGFIYEKDDNTFKVVFWCSHNDFKSLHNLFVFKIDNEFNFRMTNVSDGFVSHIPNQIKVRDLITKYLNHYHV